MSASRRVRSFKQDTSGTIALMFAGFSTVVFMSLGVAVDIGRWFHATAQAQAALDAGMLAGGRALQLNPDDELAALATAQRYFNENFAVGLQIETDGIEFTLTPDRRSLKASGSAFIKTTLLSIAGIERLQVLASAGALPAMPGRQ